MHAISPDPHRQLQIIGNQKPDPARSANWTEPPRQPFARHPIAMPHNHRTPSGQRLYRTQPLDIQPVVRHQHQRRQTPVMSATHVELKRFTCQLRSLIIQSHAHHA